ncbi:pilus assembly protein N-terminal domain-containing protein [Ruegeria sp. SCPT10]|uniref:pilus assembly protein N-terminal domain-containing protein n=1 Tax=Ruegeria sp. SCP10 TaxID=3141377 RepID=UPI00333BF938
MLVGKYLNFLRVVYTVILLIFPCTLTAQQRLLLETGQGTLLPDIGSLESVFVADSSVADIESSPGEAVFVYGKSPGRTSLITVDFNGSESKILDILVVHNLSELNDAISNRFPDQEVVLQSSKGSILVSGEVINEHIKSDILKTLNAMVPSEVVIDNLITSESKLVRLDVKLLDVNRSEVDRFGIDFNGLIASNGFYLGAQSGGILQLGYNQNVKSQLDATIDLLTSNGLATVVTETSLTTKDTETANFSVGGEIPLPTFTNTHDAGNQGFTINYRFVGMELNFTPLRKRNGKLNLEIDSKISNIGVTSATINGNEFPNLNASRFKTVVELADRQSFVIAGLSRQETLASLRNSREGAVSKAVQSIFGTDKISQRNQELVVVVTPRLNTEHVPTVAAQLKRNETNIEYILRKKLVGKGGLKKVKVRGSAGFVY